MYLRQQSSMRTITLRNSRYERNRIRGTVTEAYLEDVVLSLKVAKVLSHCGEAEKLFVQKKNCSKKALRGGTPTSMRIHLHLV